MAMKNKFKPFLGRPEVTNINEPSPESLMYDLVPKFNATYPIKSTLQLDAVSRELPLQKDINDIAISLNKKGNSTPTVIAGSITITDTNISKLDPTINQIDIMFMEGINRIWESGEEYFTLTSLYKTATGFRNIRMTEKKEKEVSHSINKLRTSIISLDLTSAANLHRKKDEQIEKFYINEAMVVLTGIKLEANGHITEGYRIEKQPIVSNYADFHGHKTQIDTDLIDYGRTTDDAAVNMYLAKRILGMKNRKNKLKSNKILFENIYQIYGYENPDKFKRENVRKYVLGFLDLWKNEREIKDFKLTKKGRTIDGVEIVFPNLKEIE